MMRFLAFSVMLLSLVAGCQEKSKERIVDMVIGDAQVIHLETGEIKNQDVYLADGRITAILDKGTKTDFKATSEFNAHGKYLLPGFWDNHIHLRGGDSLVKNNKNFLKLFIANGITSVRDAGGDLTPSVLSWKKEITSGNLIGPTLFTSGPKIDGPNATWAGSLAVEKERDIKTALDSLEKLPVDFVKLYDSRISGENYLKILFEAEKRNLITSGHMPFSVTVEETVNAGMDAIEHLYFVLKGCASNEAEITQKIKEKEFGFWQAIPSLLEHYSDSTAQTTFKKLKDNNVFVVPTLHIGKTLSYLDEIDHSKDAYLDYMGNGVIKTYQGRIDRAMNATEENREERKALDAFFGKLAKSLNDAGVKLLAGSDSGAYNSYTYPGISLHQELELMVENGISPLDALKTSAYNGAKFLHQESDYGTVQEGKVADLVLLEGNPLEDIRVTRKIFAVCKGGSLFEKSALKQLLEKSRID
ncbi:amidohydrolase family protein [Flagellimonas myxillae]|uniref:amidohydrolase family protein n=1 Tax=Flagellimonas myxillae TaxID=2942214 RepID=UPI00201F7EE1|nr:amidohydrolase family protein [Muricauda myxillae]MCL6265527.1 amidohydrolase family protein [Muricauda myxillae]